MGEGQVQPVKEFEKTPLNEKKMMDMIHYLFCFLMIFQAPINAPKLIQNESGQANCAISYQHNRTWCSNMEMYIWNNVINNS